MIREKNYIAEKERETDTIIKVNVPINVTHIAMEAFQGLPEASMSLQCIEWNYGYSNRYTNTMKGEKHPQNFSFTFEDPEDYDDDTDEPRQYVVNIAMAEKGVAKVIELILAGKLFVGGLKTLEDLMELSNWDAEVVDAAVQCAIFGEVIYG